MKKFIFFSFVTGYLLPGICKAQWVQVSNGMGNFLIRSLAAEGNNIFAGVTNLGTGVYKSTSNGTNWALTSLTNQINSLAVNGNYVFAGAINPGTGVYKSIDTGTTWTQTSLNNQEVYSLAVNGNNVFAGTYQNGVYVSNDNGATWIQRNEGLGNGIVLSFCILNNYIFAGLSNLGVYRRPLGELVGIQPISNEVPNQFSLSQNYPNPFNPVTSFKFQVPSLSGVKIVVFDIMGREVATLLPADGSQAGVNEQLKAGTYEVEFNGTNLSSGIYFYRLSSGDFTDMKKMVLVK